MSHTNDEAESAQLIAKDQALIDAEALTRASSYGSLATLSAKMEGWPFGSVVPFALDGEGQPIILIADIAEHTRNIKADNRVSLMAHSVPKEGDVQAQGRVTLLGRAMKIEGDATVEASARYLAKVPQAVEYHRTHGFDHYRVVLERVRYIGGFGKIFWLEAGAWKSRGQDAALAAAAPGAIAHLNDDHRDAMVLCCKGFYGAEVSGARAVALDAWGFDVVSEGDERRFRFDFAERASAETLRHRVVAVVGEARKRLAS
jgi:heme iron utilization protein